MLYLILMLRVLEGAVRAMMVSVVVELHRIAGPKKLGVSNLLKISSGRKNKKKKNVALSLGITIKPENAYDCYSEEAKKAYH
jgi:hypothetical protein